MAKIITFLILSMFVGGCTLVSEFGDSSGCMWTEGGPVPGLSSGKMVVCRSGKDNALVVYKDAERGIIIQHGAGTQELD